jgi:pectinesterase
MLLSWIPFLFLFVPSFAQAQTRTSPPSGALVVRQNTTVPGEFSTISAAVYSLPDDSTKQSVFVYPGTYLEQVNITRGGPLTVGGNTHSSRL